MQADIYARKSTDDQGRSVARQDDECRAAIAVNGWTVGRFFADDGLSASRFARKGRDEYEALLAHIAAGNCRVLVLWESSRGARREVVWFGLLELCRIQGTLIHIVTHDRTYDLSNRRDWRTLADEGVDSADESAKISERTQSGKRMLAVQGKPAGKLLYGYRREYDPVSGRYLRQVEHPAQAPVVRRMAAAVIAGKSSNAIARELNAEGIPRPSGVGLWRGRDIVRYVTQPAYVRRRVHQGEVLPDVEADWPAILTEETWQQCCAISAAPGRLMHQGTDLKWMLAGVPRCHYGCVQPMRPHKGAGKRRYACHSCWKIAVGGEELDDYITRVVLERLRRPDAAELFRPSTDGAEAQRAEVDAEVMRGRLRELRELAKAGRISPASFADLEADLLPKLRSAEKRAADLRQPALLPELEGVDVAERWHELDVAVRREVVRTLMDIVIVPASVRGARFSPQRVQITPKR